jgi:hypothetical protein
MERSGRSADVSGLLSGLRAHRGTRLRSAGSRGIWWRGLWGRRVWWRGRRIRWRRSWWRLWRGRRLRRLPGRCRPRPRGARPARDARYAAFHAADAGRNVPDSARGHPAGGDRDRLEPVHRRDARVPSDAGARSAGWNAARPGDPVVALRDRRRPDAAGEYHRSRTRPGTGLSTAGGANGACLRAGCARSAAQAGPCAHAGPGARADPTPEPAAAGSARAAAAGNTRTAARGHSGALDG